jgi:MFS family permease
MASPTNLPPPETSLLQDLRALPGQYWILFSGTFVNRFGHFVIPFLAIYLRQEGHNAATTGMMMAAYGAGGLVAGLIGGYLADRIGRKPTMLLSCGGSAVCMLLLSQVHAIPLMMVVVFSTGLLAAIYGPAAGALIADLVPQHLRIRAFSCQRLALNLGFALGMATAGFMAKHSFLALFIADAATTLVLGVTVLIGIKPKAGVARERSGWGHAVAHMRANPRFRTALIASLLTGTVFWQMSSSYSLQTTEGAGLSESTYGLLMALNGLMIVFMELPLTSLTKRYDPTKVMALGYSILGIGMGLNALGATLPVLVISMVIFTIGEMIALPVNSSYMASLAPDEMRGRYQGVMSISWSASVISGPFLGITLYQASPVLLWVATLVVSWIAAAMMLGSRVPVATAGREAVLSSNE